MIDYDPKSCTLCPRECKRDRINGRGYCGEGDEMRIAKIMLHKWEEPCISSRDGKRGSGAVFFSGCPLKCVYCQNKSISHGGVGRTYSPSELGAELRRREERGAYNINFVTPTHFTAKICETLEIYRPNIPVVFNTGGYEKASVVRGLKNYADIFLTDFKYGKRESGEKYSNCPDYPIVALEALKEMVACVGMPVFDGEGMLKKGVILRHLVLPGSREESVAILEEVKRAVGSESVIISLMSQYTPEYAPEGMKPIDRRVTSFEYEYVRKAAVELGFEGYGQERQSATAAYTPDFLKEEG